MQSNLDNLDNSNTNDILSECASTHYQFANKLYEEIQELITETKSKIVDLKLVKIEIDKLEDNQVM